MPSFNKVAPPEACDHPEEKKKKKNLKRQTSCKSYAFPNCWCMPDFKQTVFVAHYFSSHSPAAVFTKQKKQTKQHTKHPQVMLIRTNYCQFFYCINIPSENKQDAISMFLMGMVLLKGFPYISLLAPKQLSWNHHNTDTTLLIFLFHRNQLPHLKPDD